MAISSPLLKAILETLHISPTELSRRAKQINRDHGPMLGDEARWIIAHRAGIDLRRHGLTPAERDRVRELLRGIPATGVAAADKTAGDQEKRTPVVSRPVTDAAPSPAAIFGARAFHPAIVRSSRRLFVNGHRTEAISRAVQSVINRVRRVSGISDDGQSLMGRAFKKGAPVLQMTGLTSQSEKDEHDGTRMLMMGAIGALRNPRVHEDHWEPDNDIESVLEALGLTSMLHRLLDRCEAYRAAKP